jgi:hypothetical protein
VIASRYDALEDHWADRADQFDEAHACARELRVMQIHGRCLDDELCKASPAGAGVTGGGHKSPPATSNLAPASPTTQSRPGVSSHLPGRGEGADKEAA